jgi:hypothetical protein
VTNSQSDEGHGEEDQPNPEDGYHSFYFDRYGTLLKTESNDIGDKVFVAENDASNFDDRTFSEYSGDFVKEYLAVVAGEAFNREDAAGIGAVIMNRFEAKEKKGDPVAMDGDWVTNLGGKDQYDATSKTGEGDGYPDLKALSLYDILVKNNSAHADKVKGGMQALSGLTRYSINYFYSYPYFWEGISSYNKALTVKNGSWFTRKYNSGIIIFLGEGGKTYFFKYSSKFLEANPQEWP